MKNDRRISSLLYVALTFLLLTPSQAALSGEPEQQNMRWNLNNIEYEVSVGIPHGWSVTPGQSKNSSTLLNVMHGESKKPTANVRIIVEPRLDYDDSLKQLHGVSNRIGQKNKEFIEVGGWPAVQFTRVEQQPRPDNAPALEEPEMLRVYTYIAAGNTLYIVAGSTPPKSKAHVVQEIKAIAKGLKFATKGNAAEVQAALEALQADSVTSQKPAKGPDPKNFPTAVDLDTTPMEIGADIGANDRINTNGFGELEIATSPDGQNVVVALQGRRWVSSNDGGATFPNSGTVGAGNGDPSVAWGQSGKFYMAYIDNSATCNSGYLNPVVAPDWDSDTIPDPAPNGLDCTGIARSDDNGVSFQTNIVNPATVCIGNAPSGSPANANQCFPDQEHIAADRWNPGDTANDDQVYSTWRNFDATDQDAGLVCSSDSGVTWSPRFDLTPAEWFPRITVGQDGFVYVTTFNNIGQFRLWKFTSCVNGLSTVPGFPVTVSGWDGYQCPFAGHDRCDQNPTSQTAVVDDTDPNHIYYAYVDDDDADDASPVTGYSDIIVLDSLDGGVTWGGLGRVAVANENVDARRIMPWLCTTGGSAVVTWFEQRGTLPTDSTDYYGARVSIGAGGFLTPQEEFVLSEVSDNWCDIGWRNLTRWGNTSTQTKNAAEACPNQPQLAGQCRSDDGDNSNDSRNPCDFSDDDGVTFTNCLTGATSPSGLNEICMGGGGVPKYGDYNGNACAGGKLFAAWASANAPAGLAEPTTATNPGVLFDVINLEALGVPVITVPGSVHFGDVCSGDTLYQTLEVCNTGSANLQVDVISSNNTDLAVTVPSSGYPVTISPDFCFPFEVAYTPTGKLENAVLTIPSNDPDRPSIEVTADATFNEPNLVTVMDADYGDICLGSSMIQQLTILNDGSCDLTVDDVSIVNDPGSEFTLATIMSTPFVLKSGESVSADIEFTPVGDVGPATAQVEIDSDDPDTATASLDLSGNSPQTTISTFIADAGAFADVCADDISDINLTVENTGACPLEIDLASIVLGTNAQAGDFVLPTGNAAGTVIESANSIQIPVRFAPTAFDNEPPLTRLASVDVTSHTQFAASSLAPVSTPISGVVPPPDINLAIANSGIFPDVCKTDLADLDLTLFNQGKCDLEISSIALAPDAGSFELPADLTFPLILSHDADFTLPVRYSPDACSDVPEERTIEVASDDPDEATVAVAISGVSPCPNLIIDPVGLDSLYAFPATVVDSGGSLGCFNDRTVVLRNNGECPLTIDAIVAEGTGNLLDYAVTAPTQFPIILPTGEETLGVTVRFTPQSDANPLAPSEVLGLLTVVSDDPDGDGLGDLCGESTAQSGIRVLATDISSGLPIPVDSVDTITIRSKGKNTPSPINLRFTDVAWQQDTICENTVTWHVDQETLPNTHTTGSNPKSSYTVSAKEGNLQDAKSFTLNQCEFLEFQLQLLDSDSPICLLEPKGAACVNDGECCSGKCKGPDGGKTCK